MQFFKNRFLVGSTILGFLFLLNPTLSKAGSPEIERMLDVLEEVQKDLTKMRASSDCEGSSIVIPIYEGLEFHSYINILNKLLESDTAEPGRLQSLSEGVDELCRLDMSSQIKRIQNEDERKKVFNILYKLFETFKRDAVTNRHLRTRCLARGLESITTKDPAFLRYFFVEQDGISAAEEIFRSAISDRKRIYMLAQRHSEGKNPLMHGSHSERINQERHKLMPDSDDTREFDFNSPNNIYSGGAFELTAMLRDTLKELQREPPDASNRTIFIQKIKSSHLLEALIQMAFLPSPVNAYVSLSSDCLETVAAILAFSPQSFRSIVTQTDPISGASLLQLVRANLDPDHMPWLKLTDPKRKGAYYGAFKKIDEIYRNSGI